MRAKPIRKREYWIHRLQSDGTWALWDGPFNTARAARRELKEHRETLGHCVFGLTKTTHERIEG